jgi:hypothetical protein
MSFKDLFLRVKARHLVRTAHILKTNPSPASRPEALTLLLSNPISLFLLIQLIYTVLVLLFMHEYCQSHPNVLA